MKKNKSKLTAALGMCVIFLLIGGMAIAQDKDMNKTYDSVDKWIWGKEKQPSQPAPQPTPPPPAQTAPQQQDQPPPQQTVQEPQITSQATVSKKVGPFTANIKKVVVSKNKISVYMELINQTKGIFRIGRDAESPSWTLTDNKGNTFTSNIDSSSIPYTHYKRPYNFTNLRFLTLLPESTNDIILVFLNGLELKDIGTHFDLSIAFHSHYNYASAYDNVTSYIADYAVSFTDIKAQKPQ